MTNNTIKNKVRELLVKNDAPSVIVGRIKGVKQISEEIITVNELIVSMGECTGQEFETIKTMRQDIESKYGISIINVLIQL